MAVGEQPLADLVGVHVRDLAAEEFDAEPHCYGDRTGLRASAERQPRHPSTTTVAAGCERNGAAIPDRVARTPASAEPTAEPAASPVVTQVSASAPPPGTMTSSDLEERDRRRSEGEPGEEQDDAEPGRVAGDRCGSEEHPEGEHREEVAVERRAPSSAGCRTRERR